MTAQERQALWFLLALTLLGAGVRMLRARDRLDVPADSAALADQLAAVDSAIDRDDKHRGNPRKKRAKRVRPSSESHVTDPLASISAAPRGGSAAAEPNGRSSRALQGAPLVDLDAASESEIETLPWVGPSLAERIVRNRERCGPFGSIVALERVPGVGSGIADRLSERVTFSGSPRHPSTVPSECNRHR